MNNIFTPWKKTYSPRPRIGKTHKPNRRVLIIRNEKNLSCCLSIECLLIFFIRDNENMISLYP